MQSNFVNYALAFLEGLALIASPCILPILPIMLSGSIEGGRKRPIGIIVGFVLVFALFTLSARTLVQWLGIDLDKLRYFAFGFIILFGLILMSDWLSLKFSMLTESIANIGNRSSDKVQSEGFISGLILGALVSLIWVPCAGPILAAAIVQTAIQKTSVESFFTFLSFALGSVIPMIIIALIGRKLFAKLKFFKKNSEQLRKIFGLIIIIGALIAIFLPMQMTPEMENLPNQNIDNAKKPLQNNSNEATPPPTKSPTTSPSKNASNENRAPEQNLTQTLISGLATPYPAPPLEQNALSNQFAAPQY